MGLHRTGNSSRMQSALKDSSKICIISSERKVGTCTGLFLEVGGGEGRQNRIISVESKIISGYPFRKCLQLNRHKF